MAIWVGKNSRVITQGITGKAGAYHTEACLAYGTNMVGGVTPGKGGGKFLDLPLFDTVKDAVKAVEANVSVIYVPPPFAADAIMEAADAGVELIICITEGIPVLDMLKVNTYLENRSNRLIGPNCPGIITPDEAKIGIMPGFIHKRGPIGVVSRSGTLTYESVYQLSEKNLGQSTCVGIGGDPLNGTNFIDCLKAFNEDGETEAIVMIGEIGGSAEEDASRWIKENMKKPVVGFIAGASAPRGRRMGHAGAIVEGNSGSAEDKFRVMEECGINVVRLPSQIGDKMVEVLKKG